MSSDHPVQASGAVVGRRLVPPVTLPSAIAGHGPNSVALQAADPLEINALLLVSGARRCLIISFDLLYISGTLHEELRSALAYRYGIAHDDVFMFASHTHFAPPIDPALPDLGPYDENYAQRVKDTVLELADELMGKTAVAFRKEIRRGQLAHSVNRRRPRVAPTYTRSKGLSFDRVTFAPYESGGRDEMTTLITLTDAASGAPIASLWHYACHPVCRTPSQVTSADFPVAVRASLRQSLGSDIPVLFLQGFCGDVRPNIKPTQPRGYREVLVSKARHVLTGSPAMRIADTSWGEWVAQLTERVVQISAAEPELVDDDMSFASACVPVPVRELFDGATRIESMLVRGLRIGRALEIVTLGAEPTIGWQKRLIEATDRCDGIRLYAAYCGDVFGYLPLPEQVGEGGYEVTGFQRSFSMQGGFREAALLPVVSGAVQQVITALRARSTR